MRQNNPILSSALIVFAFWWCFFTLRDFSLSPLEVLRNWAYIGYSMRLWAIGLVAGVGFGAWFIWFKRTKVEESLKSMKGAGMVSTLGAVPSPAIAPARAPSVKTRLPLNSPLVVHWMTRAKEEHPEHLALFLAVWDVYSNHRAWPASHRPGGHGDRRLWQHCLGVVETALSLAPSWKYDGVYVKSRGRKPRRIISPSRPDFEFDPNDPLIAILALAHDIGKLEAYKLQPDGSVITSEAGSTQDHDDIGVHHDALGARILARLPEFWALPAADRRILNLVIAHYHHPSAFPVDKDGLSVDDRTTALLEFLILSDKRTGMQEAGLTQDDVDNEITEDESADLYRAFVEVVTEHGRINGIHGDSKADKGFMIGSKHDGLIVVQELPLRNQLLARLGIAIGNGDAKYRITRNLLAILIEKGLLYTKDNGADLTRYAPMWEITQRRTKDGGFLCTWKPVIIFKPTPTTRELDVLTSLPDKKARLRITKPLFTHNPNIRDPEVLRAKLRETWGDEVADSYKFNKASQEEEGDEASPAASPAPSAQAPAPQAAAPAPAAVAVAAPTPDLELAAAPASPGAAMDLEPVVPAPEPEASPSEHDDTSPPFDVDASDLPAATGEMDSLDTDGGDDARPGVDDAVGSADDLFDGFGAEAPAAAPPPPAAPSRDLGMSPRDAQMLASLRGTETPAPLLPAVDGVAIRDEDAQRGRDLGRSTRDKDALKLLRTGAAGGATITPSPRKGRGADMPTLAQLQAMVSAGRIPVAGVHEGHHMILRRDLERAVPQKGIFGHLKDTLQLPVHSSGDTGVDFIGIPVAPASAEA